MCFLKTPALAEWEEIPTSFFFPTAQTTTSNRLAWLGIAFSFDTARSIDVPLAERTAGLLDGHGSLYL